MSNFPLNPLLGELYYDGINQYVYDGFDWCRWVPFVGPVTYGNTDDQILEYIKALKTESAKNSKLGKEIL